MASGTCRVRPGPHLSLFTADVQGQWERAPHAAHAVPSCGRVKRKLRLVLEAACLSEAEKERQTRRAGDFQTGERPRAGFRAGQERPQRAPLHAPSWTS